MRSLRLEAVEAALAVVERDFPTCLGAFLAGSVVRGEATASSDLDIMIIVPEGSSTYRESFQAFDWPVEVFVHTPSMHRQFAAKEAARRRPSTSMMDCEGIILRDVDSLASQLKQEACALFEQGPPPLTAAELALARYGESSLMDFAADALTLAGGRLWEGFRLSAEEGT